MINSNSEYKAGIDVGYNGVKGNFSTGSNQGYI